MTSNKNFNMIVKKFILNEFLVWFSGLSIAGGLIALYCGLFIWDYNGSTTAFGVGTLFLIIGIFALCCYVCLQKYDKMYGLFNNWESGCNVCQSLYSARQRNSIIDYKITLNKTFNEKEHILAKGYPLYCPHCGRKLSSFNIPRYW